MYLFFSTLREQFGDWICSVMENGVSSRSGTSRTLCNSITMVSMFSLIVPLPNTYNFVVPSPKVTYESVTLVRLVKSVSWPDMCFCIQNHAS